MRSARKRPARAEPAARAAAAAPRKAPKKTLGARGFQAGNDGFWPESRRAPVLAAPKAAAGPGQASRSSRKTPARQTRSSGPPPAVESSSSDDDEGSSSSSCSESDDEGPSVADVPSWLRERVCALAEEIGPAKALKQTLMDDFCNTQTIRNWRASYKNTGHWTPQKPGRDYKSGPPRNPDIDEEAVVDHVLNKDPCRAQHEYGRHFGCSQPTISRILGPRQLQLGNDAVTRKRLYHLQAEGNLPRIYDMHLSFKAAMKDVPPGHMAVGDETPIRWGPGQHAKYGYARAGVHAGGLGGAKGCEGCEGCSSCSTSCCCRRAWAQPWAWAQPGPQPGPWARTGAEQSNGSGGSTGGGGGGRRGPERADEQRHRRH